MKLFTIILATMLLAVVFSACNQGAGTASPTEVLKSQNDAQKKKDVATLKNNLSKATMDKFTELAKSQNKSVDELLGAEVPGVQQPDKFVYRNEKIDANNATVEVNIEGGADDDWVKMPFVKEDGKWKIALDKLAEANAEPAASSDANTNTATADTNSANSNTSKTANATTGNANADNASTGNANTANKTANTAK